MSQCLHCSRSCVEHTLYCEACQERTKAYFYQQPEQFAFSTEFSSSTPGAFSGCAQGEAAGFGGTLTVPFEASEIALEEPGEPSQVALLATDAGLDSIDQAVSRLSAAARCIPGESRLRRLGRLKPLQDISADIQRASTPHPRLKYHNYGAFDTQPASEYAQPGAPIDPQLAARWPRLTETEDEDTSSDLWANSTDPLLARSRPTYEKAAPIEEADLRRIQLEEHITLPQPAVRTTRRPLARWRTAFVGIVVLALLALTIDGLLLSFAFQRVRHSAPPQGGVPALILSTNLANPGGLVSLQLTHFAPLTSVALTHDTQETLVLTDHKLALPIDTSGSASASFAIDNSWGPGFHLIVAEDVTTRHTASALLQIAGEGPSRPPHLVLDATTLDLGDAVQGANTIQPLELRNSGSGSITWSASSNQPWLQVAPAQGIFSTGQSIAVAVQRAQLPAGSYTGTITIFSSVSAPETIQVSMKVSTLPPNAGAVISLAPPLLAFHTTDGSPNAQTQFVTLSNPGQQTLFWSLDTGSTTTTMMQSTFLQLPLSQNAPPGSTHGTNWLSTNMHNGELAAGQSIKIGVTVNGQNLLPGSYMAPLTFNSTHTPGAYDSPQVIEVSLTVQPACSLLTSTGLLDFTAVVGQGNPTNHALNLSATASCGNTTLNWQALASPGWITVSPQNGQLKNTDSGVTSIGVNTAGLAAGKYHGLVTFQAGKSTQTVLVELNLQQAPAPSEPIMGASPLNLNFSTIQGQDNPGGQVVTITNNGGSPLHWHTSTVLLGTSWLAVTPTGGTVQPGQIGQVTVNVVTANLTPGTYTGQVVLAGTDTRGTPASGGPQTITVSLTVQPPCTLAQPSSSALLFTATSGSATPLAQTVTLTASGSCSWPVHWTTSISPAAPWLTLSSPRGSLNTLTQQGSIAVDVKPANLQPGTYSTQVTINAADSAGTPANNSPQTFSVTLTVLQPCTLQALPAQITLHSTAGQSAAVSQTLNLNETGSCDGGVTWTATGDSASSSWLSLSATSGTSANAPLTVSASAGQLAPGSYTGQITISANNNGMVLHGSPQTVQVTFQVDGYTVSGTVSACSGTGPVCITPQGLAGATVSLVNGSNVTIATVTANTSGDFTFTDIPPGSYTIKATGTSGSFSYNGTTTVSVTGSVTGVSVSTFAA